MTRNRNPFVFGGNVTGEGYIGRTQIYEDLMREVFLNMDRSGSFALRGLTRMGKTSLLRKCLLEEKRIHDNFVFPCWLKVSTINNFREFLYELVLKIKRAYSGHGILSEDTVKKIDSYLDILEKDSVSMSLLKIFLEDIFLALGESGAKTVVILDEFDSAKEVFENKVTYFQIFRELVSNEKYNTSFLMTCRLPISAIEAALPQGSNLRGVINEIKIVGFNNDEIEEYFKLIEKCGLKLNEEQKKDILYYGGNSPFILSGIAKSLLAIDTEQLPVDQLSISEVYSGIRDDVFDYYKSLVNHLRHEKLYKYMLQIYLGPKKDVSKKDIDTLCRYGYIYKDDQRASQFIDPMTGDAYTYQTISIHFVQYLRNTAKEYDDAKIWSELINTEKKLRELIKRCLESEYAPEDWERCLKDVAKSKEKGELFNVRLCERFVDQSRRDFGINAVSDILSVMSIKNLAQIIDAYWKEDFEVIFDPPIGKESLEAKLTRLHRARNPLAHGSSECLSNDDRYEVNKYCKEINQSIDSHTPS